jgi:hypothetical protein
MPKRKKASGEHEKPLDAFSKKRPRGRPPKVRASEVIDRAENYRMMLAQVWPRLRGPLLAAENKTEEDVIRAFENYAQSCAQDFVPRLAADMLEVMHEPKFPKRAVPQVNFLADSLAGRPNVEPRTSRDICAKERAKEHAKSPHRILRKEFYIVCSCAYKGPAENDACPKCGAQISRLPEILWGAMFL